MTKILEAANEGLLTDDEIMGTTALLASGAAESTRSALSHGMHELLRDPVQMAWLRAHKQDVPRTAIQDSCLGKHVAALEMKVLLEELLQRTRSIEPAGDVSYVRDAYARGVFSLPVTVQPA